MPARVSKSFLAVAAKRPATAQRTSEPSGSKYRNRKVEADGLTFDSTKESIRWQVLKLKQKVGEISDLQRQVRYPLVVNGKRVCSVIADFCYTRNGALVVEDTKSEFTRKLPVWRIKSKLFAAVYGFQIVEV